MAMCCRQSLYRRFIFSVLRCFLLLSFSARALVLLAWLLPRLAFPLLRWDYRSPTPSFCRSVPLFHYSASRIFLLNCTPINMFRLRSCFENQPRLVLPLSDRFSPCCCQRSCFLGWSIPCMLRLDVLIVQDLHYKTKLSLHDEETLLWFPYFFISFSKQLHLHVCWYKFLCTAALTCCKRIFLVKTSNRPIL